MLPCRWVFASGLAYGLLLSPSFVTAQDSKPPEPTTIATTTLVRRIVINQHELSNLCNGTILEEQELYLEKYAPDRPTVEATYDQKKADEMSKALEDFWKERGVNVGVRTTLTPMPNVPRSAVLKFEVYRR
jgi:hypothetical protein